MNIKGKVIVMTGGGGGIGRASALVCAGYGAKIAVVDINEESAGAAAEEIRKIGGEAVGIAADVRNRNSAAEAAKKAVNAFGNIDVLLNGAGASRPGLLHEIANEDLQFTLDINLFGSLNMSAEVAKIMIPNKKGRIINISSIAGVRGEYNNGAYCIAKASVRMLTQVLALELGEYGISCVSINPGYVNTEKLASAFKRRAALEGISREEYTAREAATIPLKRLVEPEEVGELIAYLSDDASYYFHGNDLLFTGGKVMG